MKIYDVPEEEELREGLCYCYECGRDLSDPEELGCPVCSDGQQDVDDDLKETAMDEDLFRCEICSSLAPISMLAYPTRGVKIRDSVCTSCMEQVREGSRGVAARTRRYHKERKES